MKNCEDESGGGSSGSTSSPALPSTSSKINVNPSAVPVANQIGGQLIYYNNQFDAMLVKGTGRVGASISPSNGEGTFFGPIGFETVNEFANRMTEGTEYSSQSITLSGSFAAFSNRRADLDKFEFMLGASIKYNKVSHLLWPGAGISGIIGPLTYGYSISGAQYIFNSGTAMPFDLQYSYDTSSLGVYLHSLALDYSLTRTFYQGSPTALVSLYTISLLLPRWILTASYRSEDSDRPAYNFALNTLANQEVKTTYFAGVQFAANKHILAEVFYNYYLLQDFSLGLTLFF